MKNTRKSTSPGDLRIGPFVLTKGRGARWSLKGVKGVRFVVERSTWAVGGFTAYIVVAPVLDATGRSDTPKSAAQDALNSARHGALQERREQCAVLRQAQRYIHLAERDLAVLKTGKVPSAKPKAKKR